MIRVLVSGIQDANAAQRAFDLGAWGLGFVLFEDERRCDPAIASGVASAFHRQIELVGIFANQSIDEVARASDTIGLTHVQLAGDEGPAFALEVRRRTGCAVIKAVQVRSAAEIQDANRFHIDLHLFETPIGAAAATWDWSVISHHRSKIPFLIGGGIDEENVVEALAATHPWGVSYALEARNQGGLERFFAALEQFRLSQTTSL